MIYYGILLLTMLITLGSQGYLSSVYKSTQKIQSKSKMTGCDVARKILDANGLKQVEIKMVAGELSDHYDPQNKTVNLSTDIYANSSLASISVAAHECGHAIQDKDGYAFLKFRRKIVPLVNFASKIGYVVIVISLITSITKLFLVGLVLESIILLFQLVTLPVEFDASNRALKQIIDLHIVEQEEHPKCKKMLGAAALTYVAGVASAIFEVLRLILMFRRDN